MIRKIAAYALTLSFFSFGNFGLLNIFGIRREAQVLVLLLLSLVFLVDLMNGRRGFVKRPIFYLSLVLLISATVLGDWEMSGIYFADLLIVVCLINLPEYYQEKVLKSIVIFACIFSVFALIQVVFVVFQPELGFKLYTGYESSSGAAPIEINHPLGYLGFTYIDYDLILAGARFFRFVSYSTEASVLVPYFLIPGAIALTFDNKLSLLSIPILLFVAVFPFSTTVQVTIAIGLVIALLAKLHPVKDKGLILLPYFPFMIAVVLLIIYKALDSTEIMNYLQGFLNPIAESSSAFDKESSGVVRLISINYFLSGLKFSLLGYETRITAPMNIIVSNYIAGGVIGMISTTLVLFSISKNSVQVMMSKNSKIRLFAILVYSTLFVILSFSDYGWRIAPGFIMFILLDFRLNQIKDHQL